MVEQMNQKDMNKALFSSLVMMLGTSAMQQLGKLVNPATNKAEIELEGAQITIDMLAMLKEKTKGNLDRDEDKMLNDLLSSLQFNYVETAAEVGKQTSEAGGQRSEIKDQKPEQQAKPQEGGASAGESKDPKYHKSYGE